MNWKKDNINITDSKENIDIDFIVDSLHQTYWAENRPRDVIIKSMENSVLLSAFEGGKQVGFARIVGDGATFSWLCDVYVDPKYRGKGIGKFLMQCVNDHPATKVRTNILATKDAHGLYEQYGYERTEMMRKRNEE